MNAARIAASLCSKRILFFAVIVVCLLVALPPYGAFKQRNTYHCQTCLSKQHVFQWRAGSWSGFSIPLSLTWSNIEASFTLANFTPKPHQHEWGFAQGSPYYGFGMIWGGCALGEGRYRSEFAGLYEGSDRFRSYMSNKLNSCEFSTNEVYAFLLADRFWKHGTNETVVRTGERSQKAVDEFFEKH